MIGVILFGVIIYFIPTFIGASKEKSAGILILNLFLGWTIIGWVGALIWAVCGKMQSEDLAPEIRDKLQSIITILNLLDENKTPTIGNLALARKDLSDIIEMLDDPAIHVNAQ